MIMHLDADCFYVSCERLRNPSLIGKQVAVLSSLDAFVISRSYELKPLGVKVGTAAWEIRKIAPKAIFLSVDFRFYGAISNRMFDLLRDIAPEIEIYSIDEGFIEVTGLDTYYQKNYWELGEWVRQRIKDEVGITVSLGIAKSKTLAKLASEWHKPDGLAVITDDNLIDFLGNREINEIWGIGSRRGLKLNKYGIQTALDFYNTPLDKVKKWMGKVGMDMWLELHGQPMYPFLHDEPMPKSVSRTANFELKTVDPELVFAAAAFHAARVTSLLVAKKIYAERLHLFLRTKEFEIYDCSIKMVRPTNNYETIIKAVRKCFEKLFIPSRIYRGTGVTVDIDPNGTSEPDFFGEYERDERSAELTKVITELNLKYGRGTAIYLAALPIAKRKTPPKTGPDRLDGIMITV